MIEFPESLSTKNISKFKKIRDEKMMSDLREQVYGHVIDAESADDYFAFDSDTSKEHKNLLMDELGKLGWTCRLHYGDSAMFIYRPGDIPSYFINE